MKPYNTLPSYCPGEIHLLCPTLLTLLIVYNSFKKALMSLSAENVFHVFRVNLIWF